MAKGKKEIDEVIVNDEPEVIADGVIRDAGGENPILDNPMEKKPRVEGEWKKVSYSEMAELEAAGKLAGYDPIKGEALIK